MIIINQQTCRESVTIVNGRVVAGEGANDDCRTQFDKRETADCNGIKKIDIRSNVIVKIQAERARKDIEAHLHGNINKKAEPKFFVTRNGDKLLIAVESSAANSSGNVFGDSDIQIVINNSGNEGLILDILIPSCVFEEIVIDNKSTDINVMDTVNAERISINSSNGDVDVSATFQQLCIDQKNGNIDVDSKALSDVKLDITSRNGNIDVSIDNIGKAQVLVESKNGICRNRPRLKGQYTACGNIVSKNGNLRFK